MPKRIAKVKEELALDDWSRTSHFTGKVNTRSIFRQTERMALHEYNIVSSFAHY